MSLTYTVLIAALLVTGTAKAQSALPGDILYGWKRTSEQAWRSLSPDPVGADIILANRRLDEWIAVEKDPARSASARNDYLDELTKLTPIDDAETRVRLMPVLKAHRQRLNDSGLSTTQLNNYLTVGANPIPGVTSPQVSSTEALQPATEVPIEVAPPATQVPTDAAPPATQVPTDAAPPATQVPTEVAPPATQVPTEVAPPATGVPTDAAPPVVPTEIPVTVPTAGIP